MRRLIASTYGPRQAQVTKTACAVHERFLPLIGSFPTFQEKNGLDDEMVKPAFGIERVKSAFGL